MKRLYLLNFLNKFSSDVYGVQKLKKYSKCLPGASDWTVFTASFSVD